MSAPDPEVLRKIQQWVTFADEDLRLARLALTLSSGLPYRLLAFHAQQCAEKYLKAYLVCAGVDFPYTHNIRRLRELCEASAGWIGVLDAADDLSVFATTARYPGEAAEVSREEALRAIALAEQTRNVVRRALAEQAIALAESENA
ncbi:MAG: HEPN domain-containing protein [Thermodesulfobacteriota bacterium]|jgi:HEPN domain-containing protein